MAAIMVEKRGDPLRVFDYKYLKKISAGSNLKQKDRADETDVSQDGESHSQDQNKTDEDQ